MYTITTTNLSSIQAFLIGLALLHRDFAEAIIADTKFPHDPCNTTLWDETKRAMTSLWENNEEISILSVIKRIRELNPGREIPKEWAYDISTCAGETAAHLNLMDFSDGTSRWTLILD